LPKHPCGNKYFQQYDELNEELSFFKRSLGRDLKVMVRETDLMVRAAELGSSFLFATNYPCAE
jgi:hypothetical protein